MARNTRTKRTKVIAIEPQNIEDEIRVRAYEFYEQRGRQHGHDLDDWLRAEVLVKRTGSSVPIA